MPETRPADLDPVEVLTRNDWKAEPPVSPIRMEAHAKHVFYTETETLECKTKAQCVEIVRGIQKFHMDFRGMSDIQYHFLIGGDGNIYEGRSWFTSGVEYPKNNSKITSEMTGKSIEIAFIGCYKDKEPTDLMKIAANSLVYYGVNNKLLDESVTEIEDSTQSEQSQSSPEILESKQSDQPQSSPEILDSKQSDQPQSSKEMQAQTNENKNTSSDE